MPIWLLLFYRHSHELRPCFGNETPAPWILEQTGQNGSHVLVRRRPHSKFMRRNARHSALIVHQATPMYFFRPLKPWGITPQSYVN